MTVCLAMIVRDEADEIVECLRSARPYIDTYCIIDTGSTDNTVELAEAELVGLPGVVYSREWVSFAHNRTELMARARNMADWLLLLDADMVLHVQLDVLPLPGDVDVGQVRIEGSLDYALPMIVRGGKTWRYEGVAHSYLAGDEWDGRAVTLPAVSVEDHSDTGTDKIAADLEVLRAAHADNPLDARTTFYLAQSYFYLGRYEEAIAAYRERVHLAGFDEETYYARFMLGALLSEHVSFIQGAPELVAAWISRPHRAEALRALANVANAVADKLSYPDDVLFVHRSCYRQGISPEQVSAVIVTRGDVDLGPILRTLPYDDVVVWNNADEKVDLKIYGRYAALDRCRHDVVYMQDDDVIFTDHERLLREYTPGVIVANMDQPWIDACGYHDNVLMGAGSLSDRDVYYRAVDKYLSSYEWDDEWLLECDFAVGVLAPGRKVDLGYLARDFADADDRLYRQPWQAGAKARMLDRARRLRDR